MARQLLAEGQDVWGYDIRPTKEFGDFQSRMISDPDEFPDPGDLFGARGVTEELGWNCSRASRSPGKKRALSPGGFRHYFFNLSIWINLMDTRI